MPIVTQIKLNQNIINKALFNMIISQHVFGGEVASTELVDRFRVDGTMFGDSKLYHSFDIGNLESWLNDAESENLLKLNRNKSGVTQKIEMGVYKITSITTDQYLSKQAFAKEGSFAEFTSFLKGSLRQIKRVYDRSLINSTIGTLEPSTTRCDIEIVTPTVAGNPEATNRLEAQTVASRLMVLKAELEDNNRDFNSLGYLRSYSPNNLIAVWNVEKKAKITKVDLPSLFHEEGVKDSGFTEYALPQKWFGNIVTEPKSVPSVEDEAPEYRFIRSGWYNVKEDFIQEEEKPEDDGNDGKNSVFFWAGDRVPYQGEVLKDNTRGITVTVTADQIAQNTIYKLDHDIAFMLLDVNSLPYMSGFEVGTEFFNSRSLTTNNYLIFGHNNLEYIEEYPRIRVKVKQE